MAEGSLPGEALVAAGLADLDRGRETVEAMLVALAATRLRDAGLPVAPPSRLPRDPERRLYELLQARDPRTAYPEYNALRRRLARHLRARDRERGAAIRAAIVREPSG
jgi:hypothetical protein